MQRMTPQNSMYSVWPLALKQWDVMKKLSPAEQAEVRSFVVFWSGYSALCINNRGEVCGIGNNGVNLNLLGLSGANYRKEHVDQPVEIKSLSNKGIVAISVGVYVAGAIDREGWLYWWGCCGDNYGEIRTPHLASDSPRYTLVSSGSMFIAALSKDGWVYVWGRSWNSERYHREHPLLTGCYVSRLSCGLGHLAMVTSDGLVYTWGDGRDGQRGLLSYRQDHDDIVRKVDLELICSAVKCGGHSSFFLTNAGELWACGANDPIRGYLGVNTKETRVLTPCKVILPEVVVEIAAEWKGTMLSTYAALTENGSVYVWGQNDSPKIASSVGTSLIGCFLGEPTPRDTMIRVRHPALVPPVAPQENEGLSKKNKSTGSSGSNKYLDVIMNHFAFFDA